MAWTIWNCSTPTATDNDTMARWGQKTTASRERRLRRLEPDASQGASPVLRGAGCGDTTRLPDPWQTEAAPPGHLDILPRECPPVERWCSPAQPRAGLPPPIV